MNRILIIAYTELDKDPRPLKQIKTLKKKFNITTVGLKASGEEHAFYKIQKRSIVNEIFDLRYLITRNYKKYFWTKERIDLVNSLQYQKFECIIAHNELSLPLAFRINPESKIILDAHEYFPAEEKGTFLGKIKEKYKEYIIKTYSHLAVRTLVVSQNISKKYLEHFNINSQVVPNLPEYHELKPKPVDPLKIKLVHHGIATPIRKIENMIKLMDYLDNKYELTLFLSASRANYFYFKKLKKMISSKKNVCLKVHVPFDQIIPTLNSFDIGVYILPPLNENLKYALPNKFFEFIQARLALATGPSIEMSHIIKKENLGIVSDDYEPYSLAKKIKLLSTEYIQTYKNNCDRIAGKYSYEEYSKELIDIVQKLIEK